MTAFHRLRIFFNGNRGACVFTITLLLHGVVAIALATGIISIPSSASDHLSYHEEARQIASLLRSGSYTVGAVYEHHWYPLFVGALYVIFGGYMVVGVLANAVVAAGSALLFFRIVTSFGVGVKKAFWFSLITLNAYASAMYQSSMLLKESWILFLLLVILYLTTSVVFERAFTLKRFLILLIAFVALRNLRFFIGFAAVTGFFVAWAFATRLTWKRKIGYGVLMLVSITGVSLVLSGKTGAFKSPTVAEYVQPAYVQKVREDYFQGGETTTNIALVKIKEEKVEQVDDIKKAETISRHYYFSPMGIIASLFNALFGPFPWQLSLDRYAYAALDLVWWYPILLLSALGIATRRLQHSAPYLVAASIVLAGVSIGADNLGALMRYRIPAFVTLSLFGALGWETLSRYWHRKKHIA